MPSDRTEGRWLIRGRQASTWFGRLVALLTFLLALSPMTALPVVMDPRPVLLATGAVASALLATGRPVSGRRRFLRAATMGACLIAAAGAAFDLTLSYRTEEVAFTNGDVTLHGTLYGPRSAGRYPAVVLVHGSGRQPRGEYEFYARQFARHDVIALAYDKRGSGSSSGSLRGVTYQLLAADAAAAIGVLRQRPDVDPTKVGIWALSEGEWTGPLAAQETKSAFLVMISVSAMTPAEQVAYETGARVRAAGFAERDAQEASDLYRRLSQFERTGEGRDELNARLKRAASQSWFPAARYLESSVPEYPRVLQAEWFPGWRARMDFTALPVLSTLTCPVLVQTGGADPKTDGSAALERIKLALAAGGNTRFTGILYPRAEHNVVEWRLPFRLPPPMFAAGYLAQQIAWVTDQVAPRK